MEINLLSLYKKYDYAYRDYFHYWISYDNDIIRNNTMEAISNMMEYYKTNTNSNHYQIVYKNIENFLLDNLLLWLNIKEDEPFKQMKVWIVTEATQDFSTYSKNFYKYKELKNPYIEKIFDQLNNLYNEKENIIMKSIDKNNIPYNEKGIGVQNGYFVHDLVLRKTPESIKQEEDLKNKLAEEFINNIINSNNHFSNSATIEQIPELPKQEELNDKNQIEGKIEPGKKFDKGKLRYDLIPTEPITALAHIYTMGANKYGDNNWLKGMSYSRLIGAFYRHFYAWLNGEEKDPESQLSPLWHAFWNLAALITYEEKHLGNDDRLCKILENKDK